MAEVVNNCPSVVSPSGHLGITIIDVKQGEGGITLSF